MLKKELTFALNYALNKGFQISPNAFEFLENVDVKKLEKIIKEIVREKTKQKLFQIFSPMNLRKIWISPTQKLLLIFSCIILHLPHNIYPHRSRTVF